MRRLAPALALIGAATAAVAAAPPGGRGAMIDGDRQQALFARRLEDLSQRIDRQQRAGLLSTGQATFMQQDLTRVWDGIGAILRRSPSLSPQEQASYGAMVRRVEMRLIQAEARRGTVVRLAR